MMEQKKDGLFFNAFEGLLGSQAEAPGHKRKRRGKGGGIPPDPQQDADDRERKRLEELVVMGYESHLFRNDRQAESVERGEHLIPWMGRADLLIDRYDARALLTDIRLFDRQAAGWDKLSRTSRYAEDDPKHAREQLLERKLERERYWDMALHTEDLYKEEERKRQKMAQAAYSHVALDYGDITKGEEEEEKQRQEAEKRKKELEAAEAKRKEEEEEAKRREEEAKYEPPYPIPEGLIVPVPKKIGLIIEKTANFLFRQKPEAITKLKEQQKDNPTFLFLMEGHPLHPYLKFLLSKMEEAKNREEEEREKAQEFAHSLVSDYNDVDESLKVEVKEEETNSTSDTAPEDRERPVTYVALYDFTPENEGEMAMKAGELLAGFKTVDNWLQVEREGQMGYVPRAWVKLAAKEAIENQMTSTATQSKAENQAAEDDQIKMKRKMRAKLLAQLIATGKENVVQQLAHEAKGATQQDKTPALKGDVIPDTRSEAEKRRKRRRSSSRSSRSTSRSRSRSRSRGRDKRYRRRSRERSGSPHSRRRRGRRSSTESSSRSRSRSPRRPTSRRASTGA